MFAQSENIAALSASLAKAQGQIEGAVKGKENPHFKSKYADLSAVWEACREALTTNGLAVIQSPGPIAEGRLEMTTMLVHSSGEWIRGALTIPLGKVDAQAYGSAVTYARRYALAAFVGVSPEDDDGNAAAKAAPKRAEIVPTDGRKSAAQAKRDGDDVKIKASIAEADRAGLRDWHENFDAYTAHVPFSWLDSVRDMMHDRLADLDGAEAVADAEREMDDGFAGAIGRAA
jgi:hypothetical protein